LVCRRGHYRVLVSRQNPSTPILAARHPAGRAGASRLQVLRPANLRPLPYILLASDARISQEWPRPDREPGGLEVYSLVVFSAKGARSLQPARPRTAIGLEANWRVSAAAARNQLVQRDQARLPVCPPHA